MTYEKYLHEMTDQEKLEEAARNIADVLSGQSDLTVTVSGQGDMRVRALIPDEDGYAGYIEDTKLAGVAMIKDSEPPTYVAERYYPYAACINRPRFTYRFSPVIGEVSMRVDYTDPPDQPLDLALTLDEKQLDTFVRFTRELIYAESFDNYEESQKRRDHRFTFILPELQ